jgi:hypothetical protein
LTVREIMDAALTAKGHNPDAEKIAKVRVVFNNALRNQVGKAIRVIRDGPTVRWELTRIERPPTEAALFPLVFYSTIGRPSVAPELMIRMLVIGY